MRRVLLICYYFPPLGLAGVTRPLNLFRNLPGLGWECDVLTVKPVAYRAYEPELAKGLDKDHIYRAGSRDPQRILYLLGMRQLKSGTIDRAKKVSSRFYPDNKVGWVNPAHRLGRKLMGGKEYDAIISTSPPVSSHLIGMRLSDEFKVPWVADFRDFWTIHKVEDVFDDEKTVADGQTLLKTIRSKAATVTTVNGSIAAYLGGGEVIYNGFDESVSRGWQAPESNDRFLIGALGSYSPEVPVWPLLKLVGDMRSERHLFERVEIVQVGEVERDWFESELERFDLKGKARIYQRQDRRRTVELLSECAAMYLATSTEEPNMLPSRIFDLLASGRQILAYAQPGSEVAELLRDTDAGLRFDDDTFPEAGSFLAQLVESHLTGSLGIEPLPDYAREYSSSKMAERFADVLERVI